MNTQQKLQYLIDAGYELPIGQKLADRILRGFPASQKTQYKIDIAYSAYIATEEFTVIDFLRYIGVTIK